jgi:glycosyltransferase involved in cell wall biosynthesis
LKEGITILISTFNGKPNLSITLEGLARLVRNSIPYLELILVDNASTDDTANFVQEKWNELGNPFELNIIYEPKAGKINAQNTGLKAVKTEYVLICDDDNELMPDYLENGFKLLKSNPKIGALGGRGVVKSKVEIPDWFENMSYFFACAPQAQKTGDVQPERNVVYGAGMFLNMNAYRNAIEAGFQFLTPSRTTKNVISGAEDSEICWWLRFLGFEIWYSENLIFNHYLKPSRFTEKYKNEISKTLKIGFPSGKLYLRIFNGELNRPINYFWIKEILYSLKYLFLIPFSSGNEKRIDFHRTLNQIVYFLKERKKYDNNFHRLLEIYKKYNLGK